MHLMNNEINLKKFLVILSEKYTTIIRSLQGSLYGGNAYSWYKSIYVFYVSKLFEQT